MYIHSAHPTPSTHTRSAPDPHPLMGLHPMLSLLAGPPRMRAAPPAHPPSGHALSAAASAAQGSDPGMQAGTSGPLSSILGPPLPGQRLTTGGPMSVAEFMAALRASAGFGPAGLASPPEPGTAAAGGPDGAAPRRGGWGGGRALLIHAGKHVRAVRLTCRCLCTIAVLTRLRQMCCTGGGSMGQRGAWFLGLPGPGGSLSTLSLNGLGGGGPAGLNLEALLGLEGLDTYERCARGARHGPCVRTAMGCGARGGASAASRQQLLWCVQRPRPWPARAPPPIAALPCAD